ncbi:hypothetical protein ACIB24_00765 [Spongisporangium articulatum]|uniref:Uncharacterized protein n=1 Tax=Spongisporangium articulatum TaxID=3362603 RepID=A0ABW8AIY3_9ACTN
MPRARLTAVLLLAGLGAVTAGIGAAATQPDDGSAAAAATPSSTPVASSVPAQPLDVAAENARPGFAGWRVPAARTSAAGLRLTVAATSVAPGEGFAVTAASEQPVTLSALRIGWYGGAGAREVWRGTSPPSGRIDTTGWPAGTYLIRADSGPATRYGTLAVRSADARGRVLVMSSPATWRTPGGFLRGELGVVQVAERYGAPLAYATEADVAAHPALLKGAAAVVTGSSRDWPAGLAAAVRAAARTGTNLAFFGAGTGDGATTRLTGQSPACRPTSSVRADWVVRDAGWWGYQGLTVYPGLLVPGLVAGGSDRAAIAAGSARQRTTVAGTWVGCGAQASTQAATYSVLGSGAVVFSAGTGAWACTVNRTCSGGVPAQAQRFAVRVTKNVLSAVATPKAGRKLAEAGQ